MARVYYSTTAVGRNTTTSATYQDQATLTFTPTASTRVALFWGGLWDHSSTTSDCQGRLYHDTAAAALQTFNHEAKDTTDLYQVAGAASYTEDASPASQTFKVQYAAEAGTAGCQDAWLIALELHANDLLSTTAAEQTKTGNTFTDIGPSVTCSAGNWLLIASSEISSNDATPASTLQYEIHDGTSQITVTGSPYAKDTTNYTPWWQIVRVSPGSSTTYKMRYKSDGVTTVRARNSTLIALDLSQFSDVIYGADLSTQTMSSTTAATALSVTDTPVAANYLQLFSCGRLHTSDTASALTDYTRAGAAISVEASREAVQAGGGDTTYADHGYGAVSALTASSTTWLIRYRSETGSSTYIKNAAFVALQVGDEVTTSFQGGMIRSGGVIPTSA